MNTLSIIIPCYNCKKWIDKTINSIVSQKDLLIYEIILIDDGSTDGTYEYLLSNYSNIDTIHIYKKSNSGVSSARNFGINKARYQYISFVDADDFVDEDYFKIINENINDSMDLMIFGIRRVYIDSTRDYKIVDGSKIATTSEIKKLIKNEKINSPCNKIYKKDTIIKNCIYFNENSNVAEDYLFNMMYLEYCTKILLVHNVLYNYVIFENADSLTKKYIPDKYDKFSLVDSEVNKLNLKIYKNEINYLHIKHLYSCLIDEIKYNKNEKRAKDILKEISTCNFTDLYTFALTKVFPNLSKNIIWKLIEKHERKK